MSPFAQWYLSTVNPQLQEFQGPNKVGRHEAQGIGGKLVLHSEKDAHQGRIDQRTSQLLLHFHAVGLVLQNLGARNLFNQVRTEG